MLTVLKPFPHPNRRLKVGDEIAETDLAGCTITLAELKKGRFVANSDTKLAEAAAEKADDAGETEVVETAPDGQTALQREAAEIERRKR